MARDYAPSGERRKAVRRKGDSPLPGWVWLFAGLSIGMAGAAFYYIGRPVEGQKPKDVPRAAESETAKKSAASKDRQSIEIPPKEKPRFTFYELLPSQEVVIPREKLLPKSAATAAVPAAGEVYYIQVGSYRTEAEADRQKAMLALLGAEARIEKVTIASGDGTSTFYRVRIGPEKTVERAQTLMQRLEENGIQSLLVRFKA